MGARRVAARESVSPTLSPYQAIPLLKRQAERAETILSLRFDDPQIEVWQNSTRNILNQVVWAAERGNAPQYEGLCVRSEWCVAARQHV
jgi:hypothetical protein